MTGLDLEEYTESVICYIDKCIEDVTEIKTFKFRNNEGRGCVLKCERC